MRPNFGWQRHLDSDVREKMNSALLSQHDSKIVEQLQRKLDRATDYIRKLEAQIQAMETPATESIVKPGSVRLVRLAKDDRLGPDQGWCEYHAQTFRSAAEQYATDLGIGSITVEVCDPKNTLKIERFKVTKQSIYVASVAVGKT